MPLLINGQITLAGQLIKIIPKIVGNILYENWGIFFVKVELFSIWQTLITIVFDLFP
jgi:hypothetical protein